MRSASSWIGSSSSRRAAGRGAARASSRVLAAPVMAASGVRRSCETELSSVLRRSSASDPLQRLPGLLGEAAALEGEGGLAGEGLELSWRCSGRRSAARLRRQDAEHADGAASERDQRARRAPAAPGSVAVPRPAIWPCSNDPLGAPPAPWRPRRMQPPRPSSGWSAPARVGEQHDHPASEAPRAMWRPVTREQLVDPAAAASSRLSA